MKQKLVLICLVLVAVAMGRAADPTATPTPAATVAPSRPNASASSPAPEAQKAKQVVRVVDSNVTNSIHVPYLLYVPADYALSDKKWPLIVYLHGGSLRGGETERLRYIGLPRRLESEENFPFIVVSPHCPEGEIWTGVGGMASLLDQLMRDYRVDPDRVYLTGHSMGGRGALYFAYRLPERFAAVVALSPVSPISAWGPKLAQLPVWLIHGTADTTAPISETQDLVKAMRASGGKPRYTAVEGADHSILNMYEQPDIFDWLAKQKRGQKRVD